MAVTATRTVREIVTRAARLAGVAALDEDLDAASMTVGTEALNDMLKAWQGAPWMWTRTTGTLNLTTAASYTLTPVRPVRILSARLKRSGIETPMERLTRDEYDRLPVKTTQGLPTTFYYDRQREAALFYVWPVLAAANGEQIVYTYEREIEDIASPNDVMDVPADWYEAVAYSLAARMAEDFSRPEPIIARLAVRAAQARQTAAALEMDETVYFGPECC